MRGLFSYTAPSFYLTLPTPASVKLHGSIDISKSKYTLCKLAVVFHFNNYININHPSQNNLFLRLCIKGVFCLNFHKIILKFRTIGNTYIIKIINY